MASQTTQTYDSSSNSKHESSTVGTAVKVAIGTAAVAAVGIAAYKKFSDDTPTYEVKPHSDGWQVKKRGASRASATFDTKKEALAFARELAHDNSPCNLKIYNSDGSPGDSHCYESEHN